MCAACCSRDRSTTPGSRWRASPRRSRGAISLAFLDARSYERFAALELETFQQVSDRTGIPLEMLATIREAIGMAQPSPDDRLREDELAIVPFIEMQLEAGFRRAAIIERPDPRTSRFKRSARPRNDLATAEVVLPAERVPAMRFPPEALEP